MVHGHVARGFEPVREEFERCFAELGETGAGAAAWVDGRQVVDLHGGDGFGADSLVNVYSVAKPLAAFTVLVLADRGEIDLDAAVARYWPEFAAHGKGEVTVRQLLSHQAGLVALRDPVPAAELFDAVAIEQRLAAERPWWRPGTEHAEHALFYGHLCGALVRRVDGRTVGGFWREEIAEPWGLDVAVGLDDEEIARALDLTGRLPESESELFDGALDNPPGTRDLAVVNGEAWRRAEIAAVNAHATATGLARFFAGLLAGGTLEGVRLVDPRTIAAMSAGELTAYDRLLGEEVTWGLGVWVDPDGWGMGGIGGSLAMCDPGLGLAEAYVTREMGTHDRLDAIDAALRAAIA